MRMAGEITGEKFYKPFLGIEVGAEKFFTEVNPIRPPLLINPGPELDASGPQGIEPLLVLGHLEFSIFEAIALQGPCEKQEKNGR